MRRVGAVFAFLIAGSCLVDRRSPDFTCETTADCTGGRACSPTGFCVDSDGEGVNECDDDLMTCDATCSEEFPCLALICPSGYDCHFDCNEPNACPAIDCSEAASCDVDCNESNACGDIVCGSNGSGRCDIECNDDDACALVTCNGACACDVDCNGGSGCSQASSCPESPNGDCSVSNGSCNSNRPGCDTC